MTADIIKCFDAFIGARHDNRLFANIENKEIAYVRHIASDPGNKPTLSP